MFIGHSTLTPITDIICTNFRSNLKEKTPYFCHKRPPLYDVSVKKNLLLPVLCVKGIKSTHNFEVASMYSSTFSISESTEQIQ
jgi:hypothetical protein